MERCAIGRSEERISHTRYVALAYVPLLFSVVCAKNKHAHILKTFASWSLFRLILLCDYITFVISMPVVD